MNCYRTWRHSSYLLLPRRCKSMKHWFQRISTHSVAGLLARCYMIRLSRRHRAVIFPLHPDLTGYDFCTRRMLIPTSSFLAKQPPSASRVSSLPTSWMTWTWKISDLHCSHMLRESLYILLPCRTKSSETSISSLYLRRRSRLFCSSEGFIIQSLNDSSAFLVCKSLLSSLTYCLMLMKLEIWGFHCSRSTYDQDCIQTPTLWIRHSDSTYPLVVLCIIWSWVVDASLCVMTYLSQSFVLFSSPIFLQTSLSTSKDISFL